MAGTKERTIRKVIEGGGGGWTSKVQKKYSRKGKLNEKNSCTPINPKKKIHTRNLITKKKFLRLKNPSPPP